MCALLPLVSWIVKSTLFEIYYRDPTSLPDTWQFMKDQCVLLLIAVLSVAAAGAFLLLFVYHYFITSHNLTTNEHLKKYYKVNPFDFGKGANFRHVLCYPQELLPVEENMDVRASYKELASTNSECVSDFYDY
jgi:palmitoyltransferase ZDHHC9/14/18